MTHITPDARLTAHNQGVLAFLQQTRVKMPPKGKPRSLAAFYRSGWLSA